MTDTHETSNLPRPPRRSWRGLVYGLILLTSGAAIGAGSAVFFVERQMVSAQNETPEDASDRWSRDWQSRLDLTQEESKQLRTIFHKHHVAMVAIRKEMRPRFQAELETLQTEVNALLTPKQAEHFKKRWTAMRKRWMPHRGPGNMDRRHGGKDGRPQRMRPTDERPPRNRNEPSPENPPSQ